MKNPRRLRQLMKSSQLLVVPTVRNLAACYRMERKGFLAACISSNALRHTDYGERHIQDAMRRYARVRNLQIHTNLVLVAECVPSRRGESALYDEMCALERTGTAGLVLSDHRSYDIGVPGPEIADVSAREMARRIRVLANARWDPDLVIQAEARISAGSCVTAIADRLNTYADAGADLLGVRLAPVLGQLNELLDAVSKPLCVMVAPHEMHALWKHVAPYLARSGVATAMLPSWVDNRHAMLHASEF